MKGNGSLGRDTVRVWVAALTLLAASAALAGAPAPGGEKAARGEKKLWKDAADQARVLAATFLGGKGHEWLAAGGFQPDGTIVLAGNTLSPSLDLGVPATVVGTDTPPPPEPPRPPADKKGNIPPLSWRDPTATGFLALCSPDLKKLLAVRRLPWTSGAITSAAVDKDGAIYITGRATGLIEKLGGDAQSDEAKGVDLKNPACDHTFLARLSSDASRCEWVRHIKGPSNAPVLTLAKDGTLKLSAQDIRTFDPAGKLLATVAVPGGLSETCAVNPVDGTYARGGEHHWPTGREPWRCPTLNIYKPDGTHLYQLYDWGGPYVGLDNLRQVSDSAIRMVTYDDAGNLLLYAWSDGGNSVLVAHPNDVRRPHGQRGLGWTSAGARVLSIAYLLKVETRDYKAVGGTLWIAFSGGRPNSAWVNSLGFAPDGSICFAGTSAWGIVQTKNTLVPDGEPAGNHIAVLNPDMTSLRFCSVMAGAGEVQVGNGRAAWGIASGTVKGHPRALFLTGAIKEKEVYGVLSPTPTLNALQVEFGGGWLDGYAVLLDLSAGEPRGQSRALPTHAEAASSSAAGRGPKPLPDPGTVFHFSATYPKYVTVDAEFRHPQEKMWPNFACGRPVEGTYTHDKMNPKATFTVLCDQWCQPRGDQSRRILGERVKDGKGPLVKFTLGALGPMQTEEITEKDGRGGSRKRAEEFTVGEAILEVAGTKLNIRPRCTIGFGYPRDSDQADKVRIKARFTLKGTDLGLKAPDAQGDILVRVEMAGTLEKEPRPRK